MKYIYSLLLLSLSAFGVEKNINQVTSFLVADQIIFEEKFDKDIFSQKHWYLRKSKWIPENGILKGTSLAEGNGAFLRLKGKESGGILPEDYVMTFKFKVGEKEDGTVSAGNRVSLGHYAYKFQWRGDRGTIINIMHGVALEDPNFKVLNGKWYEVIIECKDDEIFFKIVDGPSYYMQHELFKKKTAGWEYFIKKGEVGYLDDLRVWSLTGDVKNEWAETRKKLIESKKVFIQSKNPNFKTTKDKSPKKKKSK